MVLYRPAPKKARAALRKTGTAPGSVALKHRIVFFTVSALLALLLPFCALLLPTPSQPRESAAPSPTPTAAPAPTPTPTPAAVEPFVSVYDAATGNVRQISLTDFMAGLAACEMPPDWPESALCAQMAAGYSYALSLGDTPFSVNSAQCLGWTDTDVLQARWGDAFAARYARLTELARRVGRTVLLYDGAPAAACYHSISTGHTEASQNVWLTALPYLQGVDSPADRQAPGYETTVTYSAEQTEAILQDLSPDLDSKSQPKAEWFGPAQNDTSGYVYSQTVCGTPLRGIRPPVKAL